MPRSYLLSFVLILPCCAVLTAAASEPKQARIPISAENAHRVQSVAETPKRANLIIRGPRQGELILLDWNNTVEIVDDVNFRTLRTLANNHRPTYFAMSPDGKFMTWTERDRKGYTVLETSSGKSFDIEIGDNPGYAAFSPDGKLLAIGSTYSKPDAEGVGHSEMRLFDVKGKLVRTLARNGYGTPQPVFSPDGKTLAVGNRNRETQLFDVATGKLLYNLNKRMTQEVAFSPNSKMLAAGYVDGTVALWDATTGSLLHSAPSGCSEIYSVDWSPKGDMLATSGRNGKIILWEPGKFTKLKAWYAPFWVIQIRFTSDGTRLLSSSARSDTGEGDRKIETWAVPDGADK